MKLTEKQRKVLEYIIYFRDTFLYMPSTREIQGHFGYRSQTAAMNYIRALESKGYIARHKRLTFGGRVQSPARSMTIIRHPEPCSS